MCALINAVAMVFAKSANASVSRVLGAKTVAFKLRMFAQKIVLVMVNIFFHIWVFDDILQQMLITRFH